MRTGGRYVLGIDALPRGVGAAVAVGRTITARFAVAALPLEERVRAAVEQATALCGAPPAEVRLVCIDDGTDGRELEHLQGWLADELGARLQVLDLVGSDEPAAPTSERERSTTRACDAALW